MYFQAYKDVKISSVDTFQLELGSTATSYAPYSNIRPISGWTECKVTRAGKNLINIQDVTIGSGAYLYNSSINLPAGNYTFGITKTDGATSSANVSIAVVMRDGNNARAIVSLSGNRIIFSIAASADIVAMRVFAVAGSYAQIQLELGSAATAYEPYRGDTYTVSFGSAGTVYGGMLDVTTGKLTVDREMAIFDGSNDEGWTGYPSFNGFSIEYRNMQKGMRQDGVSNWLKKDTGTHGSFGMWLGVNNNLIYAIEVAGALETYDLASWRSYLSENPLQVVYPLATPIVYHLSSVEIRTLAGQNTIWADTGDVTVTYKAQRTAAALMMMAGRF